jgi:hypothetical protein
LKGNELAAEIHESPITYLPETIQKYWKTLDKKLN